MARKSDDAFDCMMRDNFASVTAYARSATSHRVVADEAVQETFIRAWRYWPTFRNESSALSWLITICRRVIIDLVRKEKISEQLPSHLPSRQDQFSETAINDLIAHLPLPQREVFVLCAVLGFDYDSAAQTLNIPIGTVRSRLARARESLGQQYQDAQAV